MPSCDIEKVAMKGGDRYGMENSILRLVRVQPQQYVLEAFQDSRPGRKSSVNQPAVRYNPYGVVGRKRQGDTQR